MYKMSLVDKKETSMTSTLARITLFSFLFLLFIPNLTSAEIKTFVKEYTYQASEFDSKASSRTIALEQVKRLLLEELGSYLESKTEVKNFELSKDKITALSAGVVQTEIIDEKWDGKNYWLKASIKADPENVAKSIDTLRKDQRKTGELEEKIKQHDKALKEIDSLRSEMASLKNDIKAQEKFNKSINILNKEEKTSTDNLPMVNSIPSDFQKTSGGDLSKASSWTWKPVKNVICIVQLTKAVNGVAFLKMATIMLSYNTYDNLNSRNSNKYDGRVFFTQLELTGYDNAGNIHYKQHESNFDLAEMPFYDTGPFVISPFWRGSNENSYLGNLDLSRALVILGLFSKKKGGNNNYISPIGTEFKLNNFIFHNISFKLNRIGNTNEFTPSFVSIEILSRLNEK